MVRCPLSVVHSPLSVVRCPLSLVHSPLSVVHCPLSIVLLLLLASCAAKEPSPKPSPEPPPREETRIEKGEGETKIGVLLPLSGEYGRFGEAVLNGISCAAGLFDPCATPSTPVQIIVKDTGGGIEKIAAAVSELTDQEKVSAIIGPLLSQQLDPTVALTESKMIPLVALAPKKRANPTRAFAFQHALLAEKEVQAIVDKATSMEIEHFILFYPQNRYGEEYAELFRPAIEKKGGKLLADKPYPADTPDFTGFIERLFAPAAIQKKLKKEEPIGLFIPDSFRQIVKIAEALDALSLKGIRLIGTSRWHHPKLLSLPLASLEGAWITTAYYPEEAREETQHFQNEFNQAYGGNPAWLEAFGFDAMRMILHAVQTKGNNYPLDVRDGLQALENFPGAVGPISWDSENVSDWPLKFLTVRERKFVPLAENE